LAAEGKWPIEEKVIHVRTIEIGPNPSTGDGRYVITGQRQQQHGRTLNIKGRRVGAPIFFILPGNKLNINEKIKFACLKDAQIV
jgi:hypothetical protein